MHDKVNPDKKIVGGLLLQLISFLFTGFLFRVSIRYFARISFKEGFLNFLIGDNGTYSLSRLQAVLWGVVIISVQLSSLIALMVNSGGYFNLYEPVFSESSMWLLGLSLTSYLMVKTVTVSNASKDPASLKYKAGNADWKDILMGENGVDFSKCQMLIWTVIAVLVYLNKSFEFNDVLLRGGRDTITKILLNYYDEHKILKSEKISDFAYVPYLPWSFVVLMGLSQGAYVGKKLIPSFKLDDVKQGKKAELMLKMAELDKQKTNVSAMLSMASKTNTALDLQIIAAAEAEVTALSSEIDDLQNQIDEIDKLINQQA
ncbi:hypothetical protein ACTJKN_25720 [Pedobacter sp. 22163]|uniref:hypothetical protein n=1 Tax=Pedobacter sp. 22163 TaxID=3453883 RepID=UPI003F863501